MNPLRIALCQMAPVLLDRERTLERVAERIHEAGSQGARLVAFGEALVPGYPAWLSRTDAARFNAEDQKEIHARYLEEGVQPEAGHLDAVRAAAAEHGIAVVLGIMERASDRGGHTLYASRVYVERDGTVGSVHRKLVPTYEERLAWGSGDGAGLVVHRLGPFSVGALNCWENWMPLARAALHGAGEDLHLALWPGGLHNTKELIRFLALEGRSFVVSVSGLLRAQDVPAHFPHRDRFVAEESEVMMNGGSCVANPDGSWLVEPVVGEEALIVTELDHARVREERQNFDPSGHYSRPDVLRLVVDRRRQGGVQWMDETEEDEA